MAACLARDDLTFDDLGAPMSDLLSRLPSNPARYVGTWEARRADCRYSVTLKGNGYYRGEPVLCPSNNGSKQGLWAVLDGNLVLMPVPSTPREIVTRPISTVDDDNFTLSGNDGSSTLYSRASSGEPSLAVNSVMTIVPPAEQGGVAGRMAAANRDQADPPTLPEAIPIRIVDSSDVLWRRDLDGAIMRWDAATGLLDVLPFDPVPYNVDLVAVETDDGLLLFRTYLEKLIPTRTEVVFAGKDGSVFRADLAVPRIDAKFVTLPDRSVLVAGGVVWQRRTDYDNRERKRTNAVERVVWSKGVLDVVDMAPMPGDIQYGFAMVALNDGRAMLLGGGRSSIGAEMRDETLFLDVNANAWSPGPRMLQPRSGPSATLMPDGSVLVAGGWTPDNTWGDGASRSTERWDPGTNRFSPDKQLPVGTANHEAKWLRDSDGDALFLVGGWIGAWSANSLVNIYDFNREMWVTAVDQCFARGQPAEVVTATFEFNGRSLMWCQSANSGKAPWRLVSLERNAAGSVRVDTDDGIAFGRSDIGFLPPDGQSPGLAVGGYFDGVDLASVDVIWQDGRLLSIAPLNHARRGAQAFRLADGSLLVAGGLAGDSARRTERVPPLELLPAGVPLASARWQEVGYPMAGVAGIGQLSDDSLLLVHTDGDVHRLVIRNADGGPVVERHEFAALSRRRGASPGRYESNLVVRELPDGRIIVAGGNVQHHRLALLHDAAFTPGAPDRYVEVGEFSFARFYEIYEPALGQWQESAFSEISGLTTAVLDDGRVVTWGGRELTDYWERGQRYFNDDEKPTRLVISRADGAGWMQFRSRVPPLVDTRSTYDRPELFVVENELFMSGRRKSDGGPRITMLQWFNSEREEWVTLWESGPRQSWNENHLGRTVIRDLPNGKRVVLPVAGLVGRGGG
ncbi:MAG: kelch repeat-containing protein [Woeseiaceae bacterium]|nr:kelch repeat-containing protein [Woeseiaceae bacterium]